MSLPSWERGLKSSYTRRNASGYVAPFVGAWIEIFRYNEDAKKFLVAPFVGAWIEIWRCWHEIRNYYVAPFVGAWIEITDKRVKHFRH